MIFTGQGIRSLNGRLGAISDGDDIIIGSLSWIVSKISLSIWFLGRPDSAEKIDRLTPEG